MIIVTLPEIYKHMPIGKDFFVTVPGYQKSPGPGFEYGQDTQLLLQYSEKIDKNPALFTAGELWMFATKRGVDGTRELVNDYYRQYLATGKVHEYDGPKPNVQEHQEIFIHCQKINSEYNGPVDIERVPVDDGEEIEFVYGGRYSIKKIINGEVAYSTPGVDGAEKLYSMPPSELKKRFAEKQHVQERRSGRKEG